MTNMTTIHIGPAMIRWTDARHGNLDVRPEAARLVARTFPDGLVALRQIHGARAVAVSKRTADLLEADAIVTATPNVPLSVRTADCGPLALVSDAGVVAAVHAGWRSVVSGIISNAVGVMRAHGATDIVGALGPCIHAECYEFGESTLDELERRFGAGLRQTTNGGNPSLDLPGLIRRRCEDAGVQLVHLSEVCTGCSPIHFSHRTKGSFERQVMVVEIRADNRQPSQSCSS